MEKEMSREEYLKQMTEQLKGQNSEYLTEVAMPGVYQPINDKDWSRPDSSK